MKNIKLELEALRTHKRLNEKKTMCGYVTVSPNKHRKLKTKRNALKVSSGRYNGRMTWQVSTNFKECTQMSFIAFSFVVAAVKFKLFIFFFL